MVDKFYQLPNITLDSPPFGFRNEEASQMKRLQRTLGPVEVFSKLLRLLMTCM